MGQSKVSKHFLKKIVPPRSIKIDHHLRSILQYSKGILREHVLSYIVFFLKKACNILQDKSFFIQCDHLYKFVYQYLKVCRFSHDDKTVLKLIPI